MPPAPHSWLSLASTVTPVPWETKPGTQLELGSAMCRTTQHRQCRLGLSSVPIAPSGRCQPLPGHPLSVGLCRGLALAKLAERETWCVALQGTMALGCANEPHDGSVPTMGSW